MTLKKKKILLICIVSVQVFFCVAMVLVTRGNVQRQKVPALSFQEALNYTLDNSKDGIISVGIVKDGKASYQVYGSDGAELAPTLHTYEIGSLTKTVTAAMVCRAVTDGVISLEAPIDTYLELPQKTYYPTIRQLLTHTSGYKEYYFEPPMTANFFKRRNDFYGIGDSMVLNRLAQTDIAEKEYQFEYSNFGYATLGLILEKVYATEFTTLINGFVGDEFALNGTQMPDGKGDLSNYWDWLAGDTYMAAGGLMSNVEDMLRYAELMLSKGFCDGACLESLEKISVENKANETLDINLDGIAYGWIIDNHNGFVWHNGATGDYNCYLGLDLTTQTAVVVLSNLAPDYKIPATVIGVKLLAELTAASR